MTETVDKVWDLLSAAATSRSPFNFLQLATIGMDGSPQLRTIVLRACERDKATVSFVTDIRSPKVMEILGDPRVCLLGLDVTAMVQLRLSGIATIVRDEAERQTMWNSLRNRTLVLFDAPLAPGTPIDEDGRLPAVEETPSTEAYARFALVSVAVERLDWLDLSSEPHQRYAFSNHGGAWEKTRLSP